MLNLICALLLLTPKVSVYTFSEALDAAIIELQSVTMVEDNQLQVRVINTTRRKEFRVKLPAGLQFQAQDSTLQDQVLAKSQTRYLKPGKTVTYQVFSYCTEAEDISPSLGSTFVLKKEQWLPVQQLMDQLEHKNYEEGAVQHAVWALTNNHNLRGLYQSDPRLRLELLTMMSERTGQALPTFTVRYPRPEPGQPAFLEQPISIHTDHQYELKENTKVSCRIYNEAGEVVQEVFEGMQQRKGFNRIEVTLDARDLPKGKYATRLFTNGQLLQEIWVEA